MTVSGASYKNAIHAGPDNKPNKKYYGAPVPNYSAYSNDAFEREMQTMADRAALRAAINQPKPDGPLTKAVKKLLTKVFK